MARGLKKTGQNSTSQSSKIDFWLPSYAEAITLLIQEVMFGLMNLEPLLSNFPAQYNEHCGPIRNVRGSSPLDQPLDHVRFGSALHNEVVKNCDVEGYAIFLKELSDDQLKVMGAGFFERMDAVASAVGNNIDAKGQGFTYATYLDALSAIEIDFDEEGMPLMPTLYCNPNIKSHVEQCQPTIDETRQLAELIIRKRQEYFAQKRTRRLS